MNNDNRGTFHVKTPLDLEGAALQAELESNLDRIRSDLGGSDDLVIREIRPQGRPQPVAAVVYIEGLSDHAIINTYIFDVLHQSFVHEEDEESRTVPASAESLLSGLGSIRLVSGLSELYHSLLSGEAIIFLAGSSMAYRADIRQWKAREVTESTNQTSVRGPRESFTETLRVNTSLVRRKIKDPRLWVETTSIGRITKTNVSMMYLNGIAKPSVIEEVRKRLRAIDIDGVLEGGYLEEFIVDSRLSVFPTVYNTELPDSVAAQLLEGKVAIMVDGTPNVLIVPALFRCCFLRCT